MDPALIKKPPVNTYETTKMESYTSLPINAYSFDMYEDDARVHLLVNSSMQPLDLSAKTVEKNHYGPNIAPKISPTSGSDEKAVINVLNSRRIIHRTSNERSLSASSISNENTTSPPPSYYDYMNNLSWHHRMDDIMTFNDSSPSPPPAHTCYNNIDSNVISSFQVARNNKSYPQQVDNAYMFLQEEPVQVICTPDIAPFDDSRPSSLETEYFEASSNKEPEINKNYIEENVNATTEQPLSRPRYKCNSCGKLYLYRCSLLKHQDFYCSSSESRIVSKEYKCETCDKICKSMATLQYHIKNHNRRYSCQICGKCFSMKWLLKVHSRIHTGEKPFICMICKKSFSDKSNLASHMSVHDNTRKNYQCPNCNKTYARKQSLKIHKCKI